MTLCVVVCTSLNKAWYKAPWGTQGEIRCSQALGEDAAWEVRGHGYVELKRKALSGGSLSDT